jgi:hypothetical protein
MEAVISLITNVGFPIAVVIALGWFIFQIYRRSEQREDDLRKEITKNQEINAKFADIISKYSVEISEIKADIKDIKEDVIILTEHIP